MPLGSPSTASMKHSCAERGRQVLSATNTTDQNWLTGEYGNQHHAVAGTLDRKNGGGRQGSRTKMVHRQCVIYNALSTVRRAQWFNSNDSLRTKCFVQKPAVHHVLIRRCSRDCLSRSARGWCSTRFRLSVPGGWVMLVCADPVGYLPMSSSKASYSVGAQLS